MSASSEMDDLFALRFDQFADSVSVFDQNLADLNDYNDDLAHLNAARTDDLWSLNQLYAGLPLKDEPPDMLADEQFNLNHLYNNGDENDAEIGALSMASTSGDSRNLNQIDNQMYGILRNAGSPTVNLTKVINWSNYFANETDANPDNEQPTEHDNEVSIETTPTNTTDTRQRIKSESEGDDEDDDTLLDDGKNSTSGFSSYVELTDEVTIFFFFSFSFFFLLHFYLIDDKNVARTNLIEEDYIHSACTKRQFVILTSNDKNSYYLHRYRYSCDMTMTQYSRAYLKKKKKIKMFFSKQKKIPLS